VKVGSEDLRLAMEAEAGRSLERFFERWVYGSTLPRMSYSYRVEAADSGQDIVVRIEQAGELFDLPVTVTLQYADRTAEQVIVPVWERVSEMRFRLQGALRAAEISRDDGTLAEITRAP
jgi:aminopeptidase N